MRFATGTLVSFFVFASATALAQDASGRIIGVVTDPSGAPFPNVRITVTEVATGLTKTTETDGQGQYQVLYAPIGTYRVSGEKEGFRKITVENQKLQINQSLKVDLRLEVGAVTEVVSVEAVTSGVETVSATVGRSVTSRPIVDMPLNGRNAMNLALLQPGVTEARQNSTAAGLFNIAGMRSDSVTFLLDGGNNNNLLSNGIVFNPNPDTLAEFKILQSNYTAEYGRNAGGIVSVVTKSGTNQFHGSMFNFLRNEKTNANTFFNNRAGLPRPLLKRNQFGFTFGGPVVKNKLFFFGSYQGQRQRTVVSQNNVPVFTPDQLRGDFSRSGPGGTPDRGLAAYLVANPYFQPNPELASRAIIAPNRINSIAQRYIAANIVPSDPSGRFNGQGSSKSDHDETTNRIDYNLSDRDRFAATLGARKAPVLTPFPYTVSGPGFPHTTETRNYFGQLTWNRTFSATLLNEFRFNVNRNNTAQFRPNRDLPKAADLGFATTPDRASGPPVIDFASGLRLGFNLNGPTTIINNTYSVFETLSWIKGNHFMKFGGSYAPYQNNTIFDFYVNGYFYFSGAPGNGGIGSGNDFADFLLGLPDNYTQFGSAPSDIRSVTSSFFLQDEWRVKPGLTLTLGLRYDYSEPKFDQQGRSFSLKPGAQSTRFTKAPVGLLFPGDPGAPKGANFADRNDFAPRFGFAWSPGNSSKMSIRGGFGMFYDILKGEDNLQFNGQAPFFGFADLYPDPLSGNPSSEPRIFADPFRATGTPNSFPSRTPARDIDFGASGFLPIGGAGVYYVNPNLRTPYIFQYNLSIQREVMANTTAEINYVGSSSRKLTALVDANPMILGTANRVFGSNFSFLDSFENVGSANYNSVQLSLTRRPGGAGRLGDVYYTLGYTFGKTLDNASGFREITQRASAYNSRQFYGPSDFDVNHRLVFSGGWDLPFGKNRSGALAGVLGGWSLYPIMSYRTGFPLDVYSGITRNRTRPGPSGAGDPNIVRADLVGSGVSLFDPKGPRTFRNRTANYWFDPANFSTARFGSLGNAIPTPEQRTYGTLGRGAFRGAGRFNTDLTFAKKTRVWKGERPPMLEFRAEFFNLFNNVQWRLPNVTFTSARFGEMFDTEEARLMQFGMRLSF